MVPPITSSVSITPENVKDLTDKELDLVVAEKQRRITTNFKDSQESAEKIPELEKENHKIDFGLTTEQRAILKIGKNITLADGSIVSKEKDANGVVYLQKDLTPNEKNRYQKAYVWEMLEGVDDEYKGEQKFNLFAVDKLGLRDRLPKNYEEFKKIRGKDHEKFMQKYFSKNRKVLLSGYRGPRYKEFYHINCGENCWLGDGDYVGFNESTAYHVNVHPQYGFSVRLLKN